VEGGVVNVCRGGIDHDMSPGFTSGIVAWGVNVCRGRYGGAKEGKEVQREINFQGVPRGTRPGRDEPQPLPFIYPNLYPNTEYQHLAVVISVPG
jgi:hypothetical protein